MTHPRGLFWPWVAWACVCIAAMVAFPGQETMPYHLGYAGLAVAVGFDVWSARRSVVSLGGYTIATGTVLFSRAADGVIAWEETAEIPLMCLLVGVALWNINRRNQAIDRVNRLVEREQAQMARRERLVQIISHEMRTPLSIAGGYVDLMRGQALPAEAQDDLQVVREEVDRSARAVDRLLRLIRSHENLPMLDVDLDELLRQIVDRWRVVASRDWRVESSVGTHKANADRVRACMDTLIENAVRYTSSGDVVRVFGWAERDVYVIGVGDSGPGFADSQLAIVNLPGSAATEASLMTDPRSQTGLGLSLVRDVVESRGGRLAVCRAAEGGAEVRVVWPRRSADVRRSGVAGAPA